MAIHGRIAWSCLLVLLLLPTVSFALQYASDRLNFQESTSYNHTQTLTNDAYYAILLNVTIPSGFTLAAASSGNANTSSWVAWNVTANATVTYALQSPSQSSSFYGTTYKSDIYVNSQFLDSFIFVMYKDLDIVDFKIEKGHGDSNYFYGNKDGGYPYIGNESTTLFSILRVWNINQKFNSTEKATNAEMTCAFPNENILTKGRVDQLACSGSYCNATFFFDDVTSYWWRSGVLSQQFSRAYGNNYTVNCSNLTYSYTHGRVVTKPTGFSLEARNTDPFNITLTNTTTQYIFRITNNEKYPVTNLQFDFDVGSQKSIQTLQDLQPGQTVQYAVYLKGTGNMTLTADFVPSWEQTSLKPIHYKATRNYGFLVGPGSPSIVDVTQRLIDIQSKLDEIQTASLPFNIYLDSYINRHPEPNMTSVVGFETNQQMVDPVTYLFEIYDPFERIAASTNYTLINISWSNYSTYLSNYSCWETNCTNTSNVNNTPQSPFVIRNMTATKKKTGLYLFTTDLSENYTIFVNYTKYFLNYSLVNTTGLNATNDTINITVNRSTVLNTTFAGNYVVSQNVTSGVWRSQVDAAYNVSSKTMSKQFRVTKGIFDVGIFARNAPTAGSNLQFTIIAKNKGDFSQDVIITYWTEINGQVVGLTSESILAPSVTEEAYERTITIPSSTPLGTYKVYVNLTYDSTLPPATAFAEYVVVAVGTATSQAPSGGQSTTAFNSPTEADLRKIAIIEYPGKITVARGDFLDLIVDVQNTGKKELGKVDLLLNGIPKRWYSVKYAPQSLAINERDKAIVRISIPDDADLQSYPVDIVASSDSVFDSKASTLVITPGVERQVSLEDIAVTDLVRDERGDIFVTLKNKGQTDATLSVSIRPPNNWIIDTFAYDDGLLAGEEKTYRYKIVPDQSGVYSIVVAYTVQGNVETKEIFVKVSDRSFFDPFIPLGSTRDFIVGLFVLGTLGTIAFIVRKHIHRAVTLIPVIALPKQRGKTIGIMSSKGGVGKTVLTANLAAALARRNAKVLAIDGSLTNGNLSLLFGLKNVVVTLHDVLSGKIKIEQTIYKHESGVDVIPTPISLDHERHTNLSKMIGKLKKRYEYILIDIPSGNDDEMELMLKCCDEAILVSEPTVLGVSESKPAVDLAQQLKVPVIGIILDKVGFTNDEVAFDEIEKSTGIGLLGTIPNDANVGVSITNQRLLVTDASASPAAQEIERIAEDIDGEFYERSLDAQKTMQEQKPEMRIEE